MIPRLVTILIAAPVFTGCGSTDIGGSTDIHCADTAEAAVEPVLIGSLTLGTNLQEQVTADSFVPIQAEADASIVLGFSNGSLMFVAAARTTDLPAGVKTVTVHASLRDTQSGEEYSKVVYKKRPLVFGEDASFLLNQFMVVASDKSWRDKRVELLVSWTIESQPPLRLEGALTLRLVWTDPAAVVQSSAP